MTRPKRQSWTWAIFDFRSEWRTRAQIHFPIFLNFEDQQHVRIISPKYTIISTRSGSLSFWVQNGLLTISPNLQPIKLMRPSQSIHQFCTNCLLPNIKLENHQKPPILHHFPQFSRLAETPVHHLPLRAFWPSSS